MLFNGPAHEPALRPITTRPAGSPALTPFSRPTKKWARAHWDMRPFWKQSSIISRLQKRKSALKTTKTGLLCLGTDQRRSGSLLYASHPRDGRLVLGITEPGWLVGLELYYVENRNVRCQILNTYLAYAIRSRTSVTQTIGPLLGRGPCRNA